MIAVALFSFLGVGRALAQEECPPNCPVKGGGPAATDCLLEFGGVTPVSPGSRVVECRDADASCDKNPLPGVCGFEVSACLNNSDPSLPTCTASGVDHVRVRGGGESGRDLGDAIDELLPTSSNACAGPVSIDVPVSTVGSGVLGLRHFTLGASSGFQIGGIPLGAFVGSIDLKGGLVDPATGLALVDLVGSSEYIYAPLSGFGFLCLKPAPVEGAGVIYCDKRRDGGRAMRVNVGGSGGTDRDGLLLRCTPDSVDPRIGEGLNYTTSLTIDRNIGVVGEGGFTREQCLAMGGTVTQGTGVCVSSFIPGQLDQTSTASGEMILAPFDGLKGFPVEISQQQTLPCTGSGTGMSAAIALTTMRSEASVLDVNNIPGAVITDGIEGEPFSCDDFATENGPGVLVFAAPQLALPVFGDAITQFRFSDN